MKIQNKVASKSSNSIENSLEKIWSHVSNRRIGNTVCFLCGSKLNKQNRSDEHVIPTWVQHRFSLQNQRLILLNGTSIPYRQLKIPCCKKCNTKHLSQIESVVRDASGKGASYLRTKQNVLFFWLSKILYGLVFKEHMLFFDQKNPLKGRLVRRNFLKNFRMFFFFMQGIRIPIKFQGFVPYSIFVFNTQVPDDPQVQFDFRDNPQSLTISCRLGKIGIIGALNDGGAVQALMSNWLDQYKNFRLHPRQFTELTAQVFCQTVLFNRIPKYLIQESDSRLIANQLPLGGLSAKPIFDNWDLDLYANTLAHFTGIPKEQILFSPDKVRTWLHDSRGNFLKMNVKEDQGEVRVRKEIVDLLKRKQRGPYG